MQGEEGGAGKRGTFEERLSDFDVEKGTGAKGGDGEGEGEGRTSVQLFRAFRGLSPRRKLYPRARRCLFSPAEIRFNERSDYNGIVGGEYTHGWLSQRATRKQMRVLDL